MVESPFEDCPVADPDSLETHKFGTKCLDVSRFLAPAWDFLIDHGLLEDPEAEDDDTDIVFKSKDQLKLKAKEIIQQHLDDPLLQVDTNSFEWLEGFTQSAGLATEIAWFMGISLRDLTMTTHNLLLYTQLNRMLGPRSTEVIRVTPGSTFYMMVGGLTGGLLCTAMRAYYLGTGSGATCDQLPPGLLAGKLPDFLLESSWPAHYDVHFNDQLSHALDLQKRAGWKQMTRAQWMAAIQNRLPDTLRGHFATLYLMLEDWMDLPIRLSQAVQTLGDLVLAGNDVDKLPFMRLAEVEEAIEADFGDLIRADCEGQESTQTIFGKVHERLLERRTQARDNYAAREGSDDLLRGAKPGQIAKGLNETSFVQLENKWRSKLEAGHMSVEETLQLITDCFGAKNVMPKAVLFASKGTRLAIYTGASGSEFLVLLSAKRGLLPLYWCRSVAYDAELGEVPKELLDLELSEKTSRHIADFELTAIDLLNDVVLLIRGEEAGTSFAKHNTSAIYHTSEGLQYVKEFMGRIVASMGWPSDVPSSEGFTFRAMVSQLIKIERFVSALPPDQQKRGHAVLDDFAVRGINQGAKDGKELTYGLLPAEEWLGPFLRADRKVYRDIVQCLDGMQSSATFFRQTSGIFVDKPQAATLTCFTAGTTGHQSQAGPSKQRRSGQAAQSQQGNKQRQGQAQKGNKSKQSNGGAAAQAQSSKAAKKAPQKGASKSSKASSASTKPSYTFPAGAGNDMQCAKALWLYDDSSFSIGEHALGRALPRDTPQGPPRIMSYTRALGIRDAPMEAPTAPMHLARHETRHA